MSDHRTSVPNDESHVFSHSGCPMRLHDTMDRIHEFDVYYLVNLPSASPTKFLEFSGQRSVSASVSSKLTQNLTASLWVKRWIGVHQPENQYGNSSYFILGPKFSDVTPRRADSKLRPFTSRLPLPTGLTPVPFKVRSQICPEIENSRLWLAQVKSPMQRECWLD